jgi:hypothetical protein
MEEITALPGGYIDRSQFSQLYCPFKEFKDPKITVFFYDDLGLSS